MKQLLILSATIFLTEINAQNIIIKDHIGNNVTNSTLVHTGSLGIQKVSPTVEMAPSITGDKVIALRRYEKKACPDTENFFSWAISYGSVKAGYKTVWSDEGVLIKEDSVYKHFDAFYDSKGQNTDADFLYVFYDTSNVSDSSWVLIKFDYGQPTCIQDSNSVGLDENEAISMSLFPNPTNDFFVVSNTISGDDVKLLDIVGQEVYSNSNSSAIHNLNKIKKGIYFVQIIRDKEVIYTEKLLIK